LGKNQVIKSEKRIWLTQHHHPQKKRKVNSVFFLLKTKISIPFN
jgi:hypothetical protein